MKTSPSFESSVRCWRPTPRARGDRSRVRGVAPRSSQPLGQTISRSRTNVHPSSALGCPAFQAAAATRSWSLWPSSPGHTIGFPFILFWPIDAQTTDVEWTFYAPPPDTKEREKAWEMFIQVFDAVMNEDFMNLAPM